MRRRIAHTVLVVSGAALLLEAGCLSLGDARAIALGQFVSFVNTLINTVTSDAIRAVLGG